MISDAGRKAINEALADATRYLEIAKDNEKNARDRADATLAEIGEIEALIASLKADLGQ